MGEIIRAVTDEGTAKISVITARDAVERARQIHSLRPTGTAAMGRALCGAAMMGEWMKEDEAELSLRLNGGGPLGTVLAISDSQGNVRGYVENPEVDLPVRESDGKLDVGGAVGKNGLLTVSRDIGLREPYTGSTELVSGEIGEDLAAYLTESEQLGAACGLGVLVDTDCTVRAAGGFIVQLLPFAPVLRGLPWHYTGRHPMEYRCFCSREKVVGALQTLSDADLDELTRDGKTVEVTCRFCDAVYEIAPEEIRRGRE